MFIRKTSTRRAGGRTYAGYRLVRNERVGATPYASAPCTQRQKYAGKSSRSGAGLVLNCRN